MSTFVTVLYVSLGRAAGLNHDHVPAPKGFDPYFGSVEPSHKPEETEERPER